MAQPSEKVKRYIEDTGLPSDILVDQRREIIKAYGVWQRVGLDAWNISRPALFLIDSKGVIRYVFVANWQTEFPEHGEILRELGKLRPTEAGSNERE